MEPRIQFTTTTDGVDIAYWALGEGTPIVYMTGPPFSHVQLEWQQANYSAWHKRMVERYRLIRFDSRGTGMSERHVKDFSLESLGLDLDAVVEKLGLDECVLMGVEAGGLIALDYALRHPERVSRLVLWDAYPSGYHFADVPAAKAFLAMMENDWDLFTESLAHFMFGWSAGDPARGYAAFLRGCVSQENAVAFFSAIVGADLTSRLGEVKQPTLVVQHATTPMPGMDTARLMASRLPDARLVVLDGTWLDPGSDIELLSGALDDLVGSPQRAAPDLKSASRLSGLVTILFTDVEGSTALTSRLGDAAARDVLREHERITREALRVHGGSEVKTMGDGFMASFGSATRALECAIAIQRAFDVETGTGGGIRVRCGLNAGEPIAEDDPSGRGDLHGTAVITAARIAAMAEGGEVLVSDVVRQLVAGKGFLFSDRGDHALKGFEDPVRVYGVRWQKSEAS